MTGAPLSSEEAYGLDVTEEARRLLSPDEIAELGVLPLGIARRVVTVAVDASAPESVARMLRIRHGLQVEERTASRDACETILAAHFRPFWKSKGWRFPGLRSLPEAAPESVATPTAPAAPDAPLEPSEPAPSPVPETRASHPVALVVEDDASRWAALGDVLGTGGYEARFAATRDEIERELKRDPPDLLVARRDGPVPVLELVPLVRGTRGKTELRVAAEPARAIVGSGAGDERLPGFLFELTRFFTGVVTTAGGESMERTEARARHAARAARSLGLRPGEVEAARLAAVLGDLEGRLGRLGGDGERPAAGALGPLLDPARTPYPVGEALENRVERFDGSGPKGLAGEAIPAAARLLAAVDVLLDLRADGAAGDGIESRLRAEAGTALDPRVVEAVLRSDRAERLVDRLGQEESRDRVLLVDPDPVAASLLEMRLANAGFDVDVRRDGAAALEAAKADPPVLVLSEIAIPGLDGFTLLLRLRKEEATAEIPFVFVSERDDRGSTMRGLELGADDYVTKPADLELLVAKLKGLVRKTRARRPAAATAAAAPAGVAGDLSEMELVDLLQVLAASGRTARVSLESPGLPPGEMSMDKGSLVDARMGDEEGIPAFNALLGRRSGRFTVESKAPENRTIDAPLESLLLEACRQLDEAGFGGGEAVSIL